MPTTDRHADITPETKQAVLNRLRRIEGQVRGLQRMVEEERYCADVLTQVQSVQEALRGVGRELLDNHLRHCTTAALRSNDPGPRRGDLPGTTRTRLAQRALTPI